MHSITCRERAMEWDGRLLLTDCLLLFIMGNRTDCPLSAELINQDESRFGLSKTLNRKQNLRFVFFFTLSGSWENFHQMQVVSKWASLLWFRCKDCSPTGRREENIWPPLGHDGTIHRLQAQNAVSHLFLPDSSPNLGLNTETFILRRVNTTELQGRLRPVRSVLLTSTELQERLRPVSGTLLLSLQPLHLSTRALLSLFPSEIKVTRVILPLDKKTASFKHVCCCCDYLLHSTTGDHFSGLS